MWGADYGEHLWSAQPRLCCFGMVSYGVRSLGCACGVMPPHSKKSSAAEAAHSKSGIVPPHSINE